MTDGLTYAAPALLLCPLACNLVLFPPHCIHKFAMHNMRHCGSMLPCVTSAAHITHLLPRCKACPLCLQQQQTGQSVRRWCCWCVAPTAAWRVWTAAWGNHL